MIWRASLVWFRLNSAATVPATVPVVRMSLAGMRTDWLGGPQSMPWAALPGKVAYRPAADQTPGRDIPLLHHALFHLHDTVSQ